ncbi:DUF4906 domain-containing protein [Bacteroides sp. 51]|uniref:fimbrial protein n=1 Tax=Bacteroides sp. 51 TaxID=2302938 RepID=UPI0013D2E701|nr:DUF4906 domain-containing protein [Bacteroides sp. 51]NDV84930.1 DUF4906 domain-containing protein [Bacteroides sp. 51]
MKLNGRKSMPGLLAAIMLVALSACMDESHENTPQTEKDVRVKFAIQLPGASTPATRALDDDDEKEVREIDVLVFNQGSEGGFVYKARCSETDIETDPGDNSKKTFTVELRQGTYDLVIVANSSDIVAATTLTGKTKEKALQALTEQMPADGKWLANSSATTGYRPIPMWGNIGSTTINEQTDLTGDKKIYLTRMVARVDVKVDAAVGKSSFELTSVHVYNYNTEGTIVPASTAWNEVLVDGKMVWKVTEPTVLSAPTLKGPLNYDNEDSKTEINTADNNCVGEIYIFEAENHTDTEGEDEDKKHKNAKDLLNRTCLVVGGKYKGAADPTYYRIDFGNGSGTSKTFFDVLRNHRYVFNITKVSGPGYDDPDIAFESLPVNIEAEVLEWNDGQGGDVIFDGQYYLSIKPEMVFNFQKDADADVVRVRTDVPAGFKITGITEDDGTGTNTEITNTGWLTTDLTTGTFYGAGETEIPVNISVEENGIASRTGYIYIKAGRLEAKLTVTQGITSKPAEIFNFVSYTNVNGTGQVVPYSGGKILAEANTNMGWTLRTDIDGVEASMGKPASEIAADYTLSVSIPANETWADVNTKVWVEYKGVASQETTFTQPGYSVTTSATKVSTPVGGTSTVTITGYRPLLYVQAVTEGTVLASGTVPAGTTVAGSTGLAIPVTTVTRYITIQWSKDGATDWTDIITFIQCESRFAYSNIVWDEANQKLTFAETAADNVSIHAQAQGVYFMWGSLVAISPVGANFSTSQILYKPDEYTTAISSWTTIPYVNETTAPFNDNVQTNDDFATYNSNTGYNASTGKGDICRYISAKGWVEGSWRLPTAAEQQALMEASGKSSVNAKFSGTPNGTFVELTASNTNGLDQIPSYIQLLDQRFPAPGYRGDYGGLGGAGGRGYFWSGSSFSTTDGFNVNVTSNGAIQASVNRQSGYVVRCVRE